MESFVGRKRELAHLESSFAAPESALIPVYGRRRVGKSELILRFLRQKPGLYFVGKKAPEALQIREFLVEAARALDEPLLGSATATNWKNALELVELGYLSRRYPLTGQRPAARHVRFVLDDPLLRFWFHFVYPNPRNATIGLRLFTRDPVNKRAAALPEIQRHSLADLYAD